MRILALGIVSAVVVFAAADRKLSGVVIDPTGAAIAEATVEVFDPGAKTEARTTTDENGKFAIQALRSGAHVVHVEKSGFEAQKWPVTLSDTDGFIRVSLRLAKIQYSITVDGGGPRLDTASDAGEGRRHPHGAQLLRESCRRSRADRHRGRYGANRCRPSAFLHSGGPHQQ
jgi:hypothetical protein